MKRGGNNLHGDQLSEEQIKKIKSYKRKFDTNLKHIKIILLTYKKSLPHKEWEALVSETKDCILNYPHDFFGPNLPDKFILKLAIAEVFEGFLKDLRIRDVQNFRGQELYQ